MCVLPSCVSFNEALQEPLADFLPPPVRLCCPLGGLAHHTPLRSQVDLHLAAQSLCGFTKLMAGLPILRVPLPALAVPVKKLVAI